MSTAVRPTTLRPPRSWPSEGAWWALVVVSSAATAWLTIASLQLGLTLVLVVLAAGAFVRSRAAGLAVVWLAWLLLPEVRRVLGFAPADPLAVAPYLMTAVVVALALARTRIGSAGRRILALAVAGYAIGVPAGLLAAPQALAFAAFAALTALGAFVLGYGEPDDDARALRRVLVGALPVLAVYALVQYVALPEWDRTWLEVTNFVTAGAPETGRVRVFSTLNSPGTFAMVCAVAVLAFLTLRRLGPLSLAALALLLAALSLTYVRGAWLALVVAMAVLVLATRGRALGRVSVVALVLVGGFAAVAAGSPTGQALTERLTTFGSLEEDRSAQERLATPEQIVPVAIADPLGAGLGQAGEASRLAGGGTFRYTDSAYLGLLYQVGPVGFLLVLGALGLAARHAVRNARRHRSPDDVLTVAVLAFFLVAGFLADLLFGVTAVVLWYLLGLAVRRDELSVGST
jgi:hypothetical protein